MKGTNKKKKLYPKWWHKKMNKIFGDTTFLKFVKRFDRIPSYEEYKEISDLDEAREKINRA